MDIINLKKRKKVGKMKNLNPRVLKKRTNNMIMKMRK